MFILFLSDKDEVICVSDDEIGDSDHVVVTVISKYISNSQSTVYMYTALHWYRSSHGFESCSGLNLFSGFNYFHNCLSCVHNCDDQSCLHIDK